MPSFITEMKKEEERGAHCSGAERVEPAPECHTSVIYVRAWRAFNVLRTICHVSTHVRTESASVFIAPALKNSPVRRAEQEERSRFRCVSTPHAPRKAAYCIFAPSAWMSLVKKAARWEKGRCRWWREYTPGGVLAALESQREAETSLFENVSICA